MVREELGRDPQCGDLYVFRGRRGDQIRILFYDRRGYCMLVKRLDEGTFPIAHPPTATRSRSRIAIWLHCWPMQR